MNQEQVDGGECAERSAEPSPRRFLVVEDDALNADLFRDVLETLGEVELAASGAEALSLLERLVPDTILLDITLPDMDGHELLRRIRAMPEFAGIPVMFVTGRNDPHEQVRGLGNGAVDYLVKPVPPEVLQVRVALQLDRLAEERRMWRLANCDDLTGLPNRRRFLENFSAQFSRARRYGRSLAFIACDIDHFKKINDRHGHDAGDEVLRHLGQLLRSQLRDADLAGRIGGEEFAILLPETAAEGGLRVAEKLRAAIARMDLVAEGVAIPVTASFGIAVLRPGDSTKNLRKRADMALYAAKAAGRNRVVLDTAGETAGEDVQAGQGIRA